LSKSSFVTVINISNGVVFEIANDTRENLCLFIYNSAGNCVRQYSISNGHFSITDLNSGVYIYQIIGKTKKQTGKLIIQ
jgi:hypothetical protein